MVAYGGAGGDGGGVRGIVDGGYNRYGAGCGGGGRGILVGEVRGPRL